jgi:Rrf2 family protein
MKFSAKTRYAARILLTLAYAGRDKPISTTTISQQTGISQPFVEQILRKFRLSGVTSSVRGAHGGHILACKPEDISFRCIVNLMEDGIRLADCQSEEHGLCNHFASCQTRKVWEHAQITLEETLENITIGSFSNCHMDENGKVICDISL